MNAARTGKPIWLITLADLSLLLLGFFVFTQANQNIDRDALASGFRAGFGINEPRAPAPMTIASARVDGFAIGSDTVPQGAQAALAWARDAARDPRTIIRLTGVVDGSSDDVDSATGSAAILASDRARALATLLVLQGVAPGRVALATATGKRRAVELTLGFAGDRP
jgi:flagellar motor protein MotB